MGPGRLHALVDGVFAIAVTLLVLDLPKPAETEHLARALLDAWPAYVAYVVSFATVGIVWIEHHGTMSAVRQVDRRLLERSLCFLFLISLVPWPTAIAAEHWRDGGDAARTAAILYAAVMLLMGVSLAAVLRRLAARPELVVEAAAPALPAAARRAMLGGLVYLPAIAVAFASPTASIAIDAAIAVYFAVSRTAIPGLVLASGGAGEAEG